MTFSELADFIGTNITKNNNKGKCNKNLKENSNENSIDISPTMSGDSNDISDSYCTNDVDATTSDGSMDNSSDDMISNVDNPPAYIFSVIASGKWQKRLLEDAPGC